MRRLLEEPDRHIPLDPDEFTVDVPTERKILGEFGAAGNSVYLGAEVDGGIVGEINLKGRTRRGLRHAATLGMSVARDRRGQGVGDRLVGHAVEWARRSGVLSRIELEVYVVNEPAIRLYRKHGFEIEGRRRSIIRRGDAYEDDYVMALLL